MNLYTITGRIPAAAPFDFSKSLDFLGGFMPGKGEQAIGTATLSKAIYANGQLVVFCVSQDSPASLNYTLYSEQPISDSITAAACDRIAFYLSLDDDLLPFYALGQDDPDFKPVIDQLYGYHQVKFLTPFENACWAVLTQRNPMTVGQKMKAALMDRYGGALTVDGIAYHAFPEPGRLAEAGEKELAHVIGHTQKADFLTAVARSFFSVDEHWLRTAPSAEVERWLRNIRGIGEWSATFVLIRALGRMEYVTAERRLLAAASERYYRPVNEDTLRKLAEPYGSWQGYWAHYLRAAS